MEKSGPTFVDVRAWNRVFDVLAALEFDEQVTINGRTWKRVDGRFLVNEEGTLFDAVSAANVTVKAAET